MTKHFAQTATVQDGNIRAFCTLPAIDVKPVRVPPAGSSLGECAHFDALGHALQVGDKLEYDRFTGETVTITALLPGGRFAFGHRTNFCCVFVRVVSATPVVDALRAQGQIPYWRYPLACAFQSPAGWWLRECPASRHTVLSTRAYRGAA